MMFAILQALILGLLLIIGMNFCIAGNVNNVVSADDDGNGIMDNFDMLTPAIPSNVSFYAFANYKASPADAVNVYLSNFDAAPGGNYETGFASTTTLAVQMPGLGATSPELATLGPVSEIRLRGRGLSYLLPAAAAEASPAGAAPSAWPDNYDYRLLKGGGLMVLADSNDMQLAPHADTASLNSGDVLYETVYRAAGLPVRLVQSLNFVFKVRGSPEMPRCARGRGHASCRRGAGLDAAARGAPWSRRPTFHRRPSPALHAATAADHARAGRVRCRRRRRHRGGLQRRLPRRRRLQPHRHVPRRPRAGGPRPVPPPARVHLPVRAAGGQVRGRWPHVRVCGAAQ
jgi:hypothetical protein